MSKLNPNHILDRVVTLWQTEDLLRAHQFDVDKLLANKSFNSPEARSESAEWLQSFADRMRKEEVLEMGHTSDSKGMISQLEPIHVRLLDDETYQQLFDSVKPAVLRFNQQRRLHLTQVEVLFELLYAYYLKKLSGETINHQVESLGIASGEILNHIVNAAG